MNAFLLSALCLLGAWAALAGGVTVQDGNFSFSLESVKKLKDLQEPQEPRVGKLRKFAPIPGEPVVPILCSNPKFPEELKPLCKEPNAQEILQRLEEIAEDPGTCEICAYAACTGC
ncbi:GUCA2A isoform 1 [Pan troglodytes]|uniref:Guanylin n=2 Tax=Pan troglodytes TaxID=9598 RepID=A0A6D2X985_PANTR|nr:guanylin [Pan troglodytes]PNI52554.1 GUCA2A isoform 1 [Pan troglodytes]